MKKCYIIIAFLFAGLYSFAETTLYTPVLVAPVDNAVNQMPNALLNWDPVSGTIGLRYEIQLDTSVIFSNPIVLQTELSSIKPTGLLFAKKYYWHVRAIDNTGTSDWSITRSFTVLTTVSLGNPGVNATKVMPNAEIQWVAMTGVNFFDYQLDTVATFDSPLSITRSVSGSLTKTNLSNLYFNTKYYRRMRARHDNDTSVWSASRAFTTRKTITLTAPDSLSIDQDVILTFKWDKITGITKYILIIADNPDFELAASIETTKNTITCDTLNFGVLYYWKVEAVHPEDVLTSPVRTFTTKNTVELATPVNEQTGVELTPVFSWDPIKGAIRYDLWLSKVPGFDNGFLKQYKVENTNPAVGKEQEFQLPAYIIDSSGVYYWKVRALVPGDTSNWSETWSFKVLSAGIDGIEAGKSAMSVYPNPAKDKIHVVLRSTERATFRLSISNLIGNILISDNVLFANGKSLSEINVSSLPKGVYFIKLQKDSSVFMTKLIIDR
jgi:hypothetical protein